MIDKIDFAILKALFPDAVEFRDAGLLSYGPPERIHVPDYPNNFLHPDDKYPNWFETVKIEQIPLEEVGPELHAGMSRQNIVFYSKGRRKL